MGDVAMLPHAIGAFKAAYPDVKVTVATREMFRPFFEGLDIGFMPVEVRREHHGIKGLLALSRDIRTMGIDAFADAHHVLRSFFVRAVLWLHGVRTARITKDHFQKWYRVKHAHSNNNLLKHTVTRYCDVFRKFGFVFDDPQPPVKKERPNPMGPKNGIWVGFAPFSAHKGKTYPEDLSREVVRMLSERYDRVFIHGGGGGEARFAADMEAEYPNVTALYGKSGGFGEEMNLISNLDCVVSMDSLVMHLASLTATPVVSVWGATHPKMGFFGYGCDPEGILQADMKCRPCSTYGNTKCKYGDYRCIHTVTPRMIVERVERIIAKNR